MSKNINKVVPSQKIPKIIIVIAQFLQAFSKKLTTLYAAKLFTTPIRHKMPKRELAMDQNSSQHILHVPAINKEIMVYEYGKSDKKVLLVHGWSGRGTQLVKIADALLEQGFMVYSFDAPAHGKSRRWPSQHHAADCPTASPPASGCASGCGRRRHSSA
jgi:pimeloyl-ACP methyl ester carboxylesterase